ncbi:HD domain-containing protein [Actinokineospora cianjurensis]|uniref:Metal dependent phosphohydrolase n=1 Tax=Actinokineospora cianjurensis TaxID=585224 RepID=A0A421B9V6_9PSEU|nr:HD domain-containing protein [Actinokineospora cianjurensis]RLK61164.1 metal dependent phosphohydrolase [Actinokineospora cianjurensis]
MSGSPVLQGEGARLVEAAREVAERLVSPLGRRWDHVRGVARRAEGLRAAVGGGASGDVLVAAAWVHDVGYAPEIGRTRFHPLDGARYLRAERFPEQVVRLVAHHSGARFEAAQRGLSAELAAFELETSPVMDALVTADLTTTPSGEPCTYDQRIDEVLRRYEPDHPVHRTWLVAREELRPSVERTLARVGESQPR